MVIRRLIPWLTALLLALVIIPVSNCSLYAQTSSEDTRPSYIWLNAGLGLGSHVLASGLNLSFQSSRPGYLLFSLRWVETVFVLEEGMNDIAVLVGYSSKRPGSRGYYSIGAGLGIVNGKVDRTWGVPVEVQFFNTLGSFVGIGLLGFVDFNTEETFCGVLVCLQFGKLR